MFPPPLDDALTRAVLAFLRVEAAPPSLALLAALLDSYVRRVPWESASRIARRARIARTGDCPRWPEMFWPEATTLGTGGTCYESNYAFAALLCALGYAGYLTINNMRENIGCHAAIIVTLGAARVLVDVGLPAHCPLQLDASAKTSRESDFHTYSATPDGAGHFLIERDRHPNPYCYLLVDTPVSGADFRAIMTQDYDPDTGQFLGRVIAVKVIDGQIWRFNSAEGPPYHLETFVAGGKRYYHLGSDPLAAAGQVAARFGMGAGVVGAAMQALGRFGDR